MATFEMMMDPSLPAVETEIGTVKTTNMTPGGADNPPLVPVHLAARQDARSGHGGIGYIDQTAGGSRQPRADAMMRGPVGITSHRSITGPFNGDYISRSVPVIVQSQGSVGLNRGGAGIRALSADVTNPPDQGTMTASFTNPAVAALIRRWAAKR